MVVVLMVIVLTVEPRVIDEISDGKPQRWIQQAVSFFGPINLYASTPDICIDRRVLPQSEHFPFLRSNSSEYEV